MIRTHEIESTRTVLLLVLIAVVCSLAAVYLVLGGVDGSGSINAPTASDNSLPHAFPGG